MMQEREFVFGWDPKSSKRSSGLFSVLKWFGNKESVSAPSQDLTRSASSSCDSIESVFSTDTVASFAFVSPNSYKPFGAALQAEKYILPGPETSTYRARLAQREVRRETDRNLTLRSKYNLYKSPEPDRGHSLPLISKSFITEQQGMHRRTVSESSKHRHAGAYCHVKGKRKAPQPPGSKGESTLRRKKRLAPQPPSVSNPDVICNDSLKLDHGILKPAKEQLETVSMKTVQIQEVVQVSPRPWYKRTLSKNSTSEKKPDQEKRKSGLSFLTNISELDREAMEIVGKESLKMKYLKTTNQVPAFMRPKGNEHVRTNSDSWLSPKRKSARDLIAKFNAITGVSRNTSRSESKESIKEQSPPAKESNKQEIIIPVEQEVQPCSSKSEKKESHLNSQVPRTTAIVKPISRAQWNCPKCTLENDYWRIICKVCSTIKPYFDDFTSISTTSSPLTETKINTEGNKLEKKDSTDLFSLGSVECRISDLQRSVFQSKYPKLPHNFNSSSDAHSLKQNVEPELLTAAAKQNIPNGVKDNMHSDFFKFDHNTDDKLSKLVGITNIDSINETKSELTKPNIQNIFQPEYPKINLNYNVGNELAESKFGFNKLGDNTKQTSNQNVISSINDKNINVDIKNKEINIQTTGLNRIEKIILGDELEFSQPKVEKETENLHSSEGKSKFEKMILGDEISVEKPEYVNVKYDNIEANITSTTSKLQKIEKIILGDELEVQNSCVYNTEKLQTINNKVSENSTTSKLKQISDENKEADTKKEEREKLKKMLIEMKNSLPKRNNKYENKENKHRVSLIQEQSEAEQEAEDEKTAEIIVATTETVYENIKVKRSSIDKPVKVSSSVQTNAILRRYLSPKETSAIQNSKSGFHLIKAKDFVCISNEKTGNLDNAHTYANLNVTESKDPDVFAGCSKTDTLEINRLLRRLETAIAGGELGQAAVFARELAQLKVPLNVIRQKSEEADKQKNNTHFFNVDMYVEDKISHRGPFPLKVTEIMTVADLKELVENKYKIPRGVQRWILGKQLATDDNASLATHQIISSGCPVFLYLVAPANEPKSEANTVEIIEVNDLEPVKPLAPNIVYNVPIAIIEEDVDEEDTQEGPNDDETATTLEAIDFEDNVQELWKCRACTLLNSIVSDKCEVCGLIRHEAATASSIENQTYLQLVNLDNEDLVRNVDTFECLVCLAECPSGEGVTLRECLHQFCRACLAHTVEFSEEAEVKCPYRDEQYSCDIALQDREVKALVSAVVYEQHLAKSVKQAENKMDNTFHCKTPDCRGWCIYEDNVNDFHCPVCTKNNCLTCQAIHIGMNCKQYQEQMKSQSETDEEARRTRDFLEDMIARGEALACPTCQVVLLKKWGCDWLRCSMCKTEICWVTRGPRWGPGGKGDTSAGCKCGVNGVKCHPKCNYCH